MDGHSIAGMSTTRDRVDDDYYATPPEATQELLYNFDLTYKQLQIPLDHLLNPNNH